MRISRPRQAGLGAAQRGVASAKKRDAATRARPGEAPAFGAPDATAARRDAHAVASSRGRGVHPRRRRGNSWTRSRATSTPPRWWKPAASCTCWARSARTRRTCWTSTSISSSASTLRSRTSPTCRSAGRRGGLGAEATVRDLHTKINGARTLIAVSLAGIHDFETAATSATSPILGPSQLTAQADGRLRRRRSTTRRASPCRSRCSRRSTSTRAPRPACAAMSRSRSRSSRPVASPTPGAQATDNNFAGIGWCDSCPHGFDFPDAETGVRAQMQLLRIYVDPTFPDAGVQGQDPLARNADPRLPRPGADLVGPVGHVGDGRALRPAGVRHLRAHGRVREARPDATRGEDRSSGAGCCGRRRRRRVKSPEARGCSRTGRWRIPVCLLLRVHSTGPASSIAPTRASSSSSTTRISSRARFAPRQWCTPWPKPRCGFGSRRGRSGTDRRTRPRRGLPTLPRTRPCRPARTTSPNSSTSRASRSAGCTPRDASTARSPPPPSPHRRRSSRSACQLVGERVERDDRARDRVAGRVGARRPQQARRRTGAPGR